MLMAGPIAGKESHGDGWQHQKWNAGARPKRWVVVVWPAANQSGGAMTKGGGGARSYGGQGEPAGLPAREREHKQEQGAGNHWDEEGGRR